MKKTTAILVAATTSSLLAPSLHAATIIATELGFAVSGKNSSSHNFDQNANLIWGAGSQQAANGSADSANHRSGQVFAEFTLTQQMIDEANLAGATVSLGYFVDSIGVGLTPAYTDGLDLQYFGIAAGDRTNSALWAMPGVNTANTQVDILATTANGGLAGSKSIDLINASILNDIKGATAGQRIAFTFWNSAGTDTAVPVGNAASETYAFQMNHTAANYTLSVVPEPSVALLGGLGLLGLLRRRR